MNRIARTLLLIILALTSTPILASPQKLLKWENRLNALRKRLISGKHSTNDAPELANDWRQYARKIRKYSNNTKIVESWGEIERRIDWHTPHEEAAPLVKKLERVAKKLKSSKEYTAKEIKGMKKEYYRLNEKIAHINNYKKGSGFPAEPIVNAKVVTPAEKAKKHVGKLTRIHKKMMSGKGYPQDTIDKYLRSYNKAYAKIKRMGPEAVATTGSLPQQLTPQNIKVKAISPEELAKRYVAKALRLKKKMGMDGHLTEQEQMVYKKAYAKARTKAIKIDKNAAVNLPADPPLGKPEDKKARVAKLRKKLDSMVDKLGNKNKELARDDIAKHQRSYLKARKKLAATDPEIVKLYKDKLTRANGGVLVKEISNEKRVEKLIKKLVAINKEVDKGVTAGQHKLLSASFDKAVLKIKRLAPNKAFKPDHITRPANFIDPKKQASKYFAKIKEIDHEIKSSGWLKRNSRWTNVNKLTEEREKYVSIIHKLDAESEAGGSLIAKIPNMPKPGGESKSRDDHKKKAKDIRKERIEHAKKHDAKVYDKLMAQEEKKHKKKSKNWFKRKFGGSDDDDDKKYAGGGGAMMGGGMGGAAGGFGGGMAGGHYGQQQHAPQQPAPKAEEATPADTLTAEERREAQESFSKLESIADGESDEYEDEGYESDDEYDEDSSGLDSSLNAIAQGSDDYNDDWSSKTTFGHEGPNAHLLESVSSESQTETDTEPVIGPNQPEAMDSASSEGPSLEYDPNADADDEFDSNQESGEWS